MNKSRRIGGACICIISIFTSSVSATGVPGQGTWEFSLEARDFDGDTNTIEGYYDNVLGITWLADANYAQTSGFDADGLMKWAEANTWASGLDIAGITGWRLPNTLEPDPSCDPRIGNDHFVNCTGSELGNLFYNALGNTAGSLSNTGPFNHIQIGWYWSATLCGQCSRMAWIFNMYSGDQNYFGIDSGGVSAWVVHDGDVGSPIIPTPVFSCVGDMFEPPFSELITLKNKVKRAIPVKMQLVNADGYLITDMNISSPPVVNVSYNSAAGENNNNNYELVPPGLADDGNEFRFDDPYWVINLATKQFSSEGTYEVIAVAGDESYSIDAISCSGTFVRLP